MTFLVPLKLPISKLIEAISFSIMTFLVPLKPAFGYSPQRICFSIMTFLVSLKQTFKELVSLIYITTLQKKL